MLSPADARAYVKQLDETDRILEELRWKELVALNPRQALKASDMLIDAALRVPLPPHRRTWSASSASPPSATAGRAPSGIARPWTESERR